MKQEGTIWINLDGANFEQVERCRIIIHTLFEQGFFNIRNGNMNVHFDHLGNLAALEAHYFKWKRDKISTPLHNLLEGARIEVTSPQASIRSKVEV